MNRGYSLAPGPFLCTPPAENGFHICAGLGGRGGEEGIERARGPAKSVFGLWPFRGEVHDPTGNDQGLPGAGDSAMDKTCFPREQWSCGRK